MDMEAEMLVANQQPLPIPPLLGRGIFSTRVSSSHNRGIYIPELIRELRKDGWTIKFLSDMYLPSSFLESILIREGFISPLPNGGGEGGGAVIVSCEWGARKDTGTLYKKVKEKNKPKVWIHFGDNKRSDYKQAKKNGIKAYRVDTSFNPIEKKVSSLANNSRNPYQTKLLAGLMRYARLTFPSHYGEGLGVRLENLEGDLSLASDYIAPLYVPYVAFVLKQAREMGIKRLYFLSRDGYIMHEIAKSLDPKDIELKYLFVSRKALIPAFLFSRSSLSGGLKGAFLQITDRQHLIGRTVDYLLNQLQLNRQDLNDKFDIKFNFNKILNKKQQDEFLDKLFNNPKFTPWLIFQLEEKAKLVLSYLTQEGLKVSPFGGDLEGASEKTALVDIGWLGTTRLMINEIISSNSPIHVREGEGGGTPTFYLGVRGDVYPRSYGDYLSYFPYGSLSTEATGLIENYYSASPWPSTIGYALHPNHPLSGMEADYPLGGGDKEGIIPIFKKGEEFKMNPIIETNVRVASEMAKDLKPFLDIIDEEILFLWASVTVESLSNMEFSIDLTAMTRTSEFDGVPMVKNLSPAQIFNLVFLGGRVTAFDQGSLSYTVGHKVSNPLWKIHKITGRGRSLLYRVLLKLKS